jgi:cytoskeletal protein CcmA (bactofilin family)
MISMSRVAFVAMHALVAATMLIGAPSHAAKDIDTEGVIIDTDKSLVLAGGRVSPGKPVPENFVGFGGRVVVDQPVGGNVVAAGGTVDIRSPVGGKAALAGGTVNIDAPVGGNVATAGGDVRINRGAVIGGRAKIMAGNTMIDGTINGDLRVSADLATINGTVNGDVKAVVEKLVLGPGAKITGKLTYVADGEVQRAEGAVVAGEIKRLDESSAMHDEVREQVTAGVGVGARIFGNLIAYAALLACGALFLAVAPIFCVEAPDRLKASPGKSVGVGLLTLIGGPVLAVICMITLIGIPLGLILIALYPFALLLGFLVSALFVAGFVPRLLRKPPPPTVAKAIGYFAVSLAALMLVAKVPSLGGWVILVLLVIGVGAFEVELFRRMRVGSRTFGGVEVVRS